jgi:hypothetical protein
VKDRRQAEKSPQKLGRQAAANLLKRLKFLARFEPHSLAGGNRNLGAGARIPANPGLARFHVENPEAAKLDPITFGKCVLHGFEDRFNGNLRLGFGYARPGHDLIDDVELDHGNLLKIQALMLESGIAIVKPFLL